MISDWFLKSQRLGRSAELWISWIPLVGDQRLKIVEFRKERAWVIINRLP
jgi:hypothetical protein